MKEKFNKYICDFEGCRHRNEENVCCLFNPDNCVYFKKVMDLKSENLALDRAYTELYKQYEEVKANADYQLEGRDNEIKGLKAQIEKTKCALKKIIKTVQNDNISGYGDRLVIIYDISCEVLQEIKEK